MDRVKAHKELDEASRQADFLSRRLSDAASAIAYGNFTVDWSAIQCVLQDIQNAVDRVREQQEPRKTA